MANSIDPDETARYEPSHLDLHCLQKYQIWSTELKGLSNLQISRHDRIWSIYQFRN